MHGGIPQGRYQTRGGEVSDARRDPAGKVYIRRAEVSDARRYPADAQRYQTRGAEGAYVREGGGETSRRAEVSDARS